MPWGTCVGKCGFREHGVMLFFDNFLLFFDKDKCIDTQGSTFGPTSQQGEEHGAGHRNA